MKKEDVSDYCWLNTFGGTSTNAVQDTCTHEAAVRFGASPPDHGTETDELTRNVDDTTAKGSAQWNPNEVGESKNQDGDTSELDDILNRAVELLDVVAKGRRECQRSESLSERDERAGCDCRSLPLPAPVQGIVRVGRWLRDKDTLATFDEVVSTDICHDLRAGKNLCVELLLNLVKLLGLVRTKLQHALC